MAERLVNLGWRLAVMGMIGAGGLIALALAYSGLLDLLALRFRDGAGPALAGIAVAIAVFIVCRLRSDLVCD